MSDHIPCRCLLADSFPTLQATVADYVASLPEETRADPALYGARLRVCTECVDLRDGTCMRCGCYVEARAAKRIQRCPSVPPKW